MHIAKKYFSFGGLDREKTGWERIRNAKNIHSSLLTFIAGRSFAAPLHSGVSSVKYLSHISISVEPASGNQSNQDNEAQRDKVISVPNV